MLFSNYYLFLCTAMFSLTVVLPVNSAGNSVPKLPKSFKRCRRRDPELNACMKIALKSALPDLIKGIPSLGVLPIDPLNIMNLGIKQGSGPVSIDLTFININMTGIGSLVLRSVDTNWDEYKLETRVDLIEPIVLQGDYKINGKVLILPISGIGKCKLTLSNVTAFIGVYGKELIRNKKSYMEVTDLKFRFNTTRLHVYLGNLFNGDKALGDNMNSFLNENWSDIFKELHPSIEAALSQAFKEISNRIFLKVPFNQIVLE
ncbi:protein takeout-like [Lycorma delicatula]|uniref:protein takeout-like n=1 Tax=Lycorma delicatula TaxID=130591 RepID=UPI003F519AF7